MAEPMPSGERGRVVEWRDTEGYGFIRPDRSGPDVFFHISAVAGRRRPRAGDRIRFVRRPHGSRPRAAAVRLPAFRPAPITLATTGFVLGGAGIVALAVWEVVPVPWPLVVYAVMSLVTYAAYGVDKRRAAGRRRRIPEATLHGLELAGGWPGGFVAQHFFRHKRHKASYQLVFWLIGAMHVGLWSWWFLGR